MRINIGIKNFILISVLFFMTACGAKLNSTDEAAQEDLSSSSNGQPNTSPVPPLIVNNLMPLTVNAGASLIAGQFCIGVAGSLDGLVFKWFKNNMPAKYDASKRCYLVPMLNVDDVGDYEVEVSNSFGKVRSATARLSVNGPPVITQELAALSVSVGTSLAAGQFCVTATGANLAYSWAKNGQVAAFNANRRCYITSSLTEQDTGYYTVTITGPGGSVSSMAGLTVGSGVLPPLTGVTITSQLVPVSLREGASLIAGQFCVTAFGSDLSYEWKKDGVVAPYSANKRCYITPALSEADSGSYTVTVSNSGGSASSTAALEVVALPVISTNLSALSVVAESALVAGQFCVTATGKNLVYSWKKGNVEAPYNANKRCYLIPFVNMADAGSYSVTVSNAGGNVTSTASLAVTASAGTAVLTKSLQDLTVRAETALAAGQFCVEATGTELTYSWKKDGVTAPHDANRRCYITPALSPADSGVYTVTVSNRAATVTSTANLSVLTPAAITVPLANLSVQVNTMLAAGQFCVNAIGSNLSYEWKKNGVAARYNANRRCYITDFLTAEDAGEYSVIVSNSVSSATSSANLTVTPAGVTVSSSDLFNSAFDRSIIVAGYYYNQATVLKIQSAYGEMLYACLEFKAKESNVENKNCDNVNQFVPISELPKYGWSNKSNSEFRSYELIEQNKNLIKSGEYTLHVRNVYNQYVKGSSFIVD